MPRVPVIALQAELRLATETLDIAYEVDGPRDGFPVILAHGFPDGIRTWDAVVIALAKEPLRLYRPFLRGFGGTRTREGIAPTAETAALGDDIVRFADALGIDRYGVVGHDFGARAAYAACVVAPSRIGWAVALSTPYTEGVPAEDLSAEQIEAFWYQWFLHVPGAQKRLRRDPIGWSRMLWRRWSPRWADAQAAMQDVEADQGGPQWADIVVSYYRHRWRGVATSPRYAAAQALLATQPRISVPTTLVVGMDDACNLPATSLGQEAFFVEHCRIEVEGAGHFIQRQFPHTVAAAICARAIG